MMDARQKKTLSSAGMKASDCIVTLFVLVFTMMPLIIIVLLAFGSSWDATFRLGFTLDWMIETVVTYRNTFFYSVVIAAITMLLTLLFGTLAAYGIITKKIRRTGMLLDAIIMLPLTISHIVIGLALILAFNSPPIRLHGTIWIVIIGHFIIAMPIAYRTISATLESIDLSLVEAAKSLGATETTAVRRVIMPLAVPGLIACSMFSFISSIGNYALTLMIAPERMKTLPLQLVSFISAEAGVFSNFNLAAALSLFIIIIIFVLDYVIRKITGASWQEKMQM
ncbi:MAG: ABC transporter permease subunit [Syntrophales bacterium]|nr:ABC transporter permease subunit [Syntrophales bacterium]